MKKITALAAALLMLGSSLAVGQHVKPRQFGFQGDIGPALIPTTPANVCFANGDGTCAADRTVYVTSITLTEESGTTDTCYILDRSATPRALFGTAASPAQVLAGSTYVMTFPYRRMPGGVTWACTNGTVAAYMTYEY